MFVLIQVLNRQSLMAIYILDVQQYMRLSLMDLHDWQGSDGIKAYGIEKLIQLAASQLSDKLPESREAARDQLLDLQNVYEKTLDMMPIDVSENPQINSWEHFCQSKLSPLSALAVLRVTNVARQYLVLVRVVYAKYRVLVSMSCLYSIYTCKYHQRREVLEGTVKSCTVAIKTYSVMITRFIVIIHWRMHLPNIVVILVTSVCLPYQ